MRLADRKVTVELRTNLLRHVKADSIAAGVNLEEFVQLLALDDIGQERHLDHKDASSLVSLLRACLDIDFLAVYGQIDGLRKHVLKDLQDAFGISLNFFKRITPYVHTDRVLLAVCLNLVDVYNLLDRLLKGESAFIGRECLMLNFLQVR